MRDDEGTVTLTLRSQAAADVLYLALTEYAESQHVLHEAMTAAADPEAVDPGLNALIAQRIAATLYDQLDSLPDADPLGGDAIAR